MTDRIAYNSCRNRHCPKCQSSIPPSAGSKTVRPISWTRRVLPRGLHPAGTDRGSRLSEQGRRLYDLLLRVSAETLTTIAADPKTPRRQARFYLGAAHLGLRHDPPSPRPLHRPRWRPVRSMEKRWVPCKPRLLPAGTGALPAVPAAVPRAPQPSPSMTIGCSSSDQLLPSWPTRRPSSAYIEPLTKTDWVVYAKRPFAGPDAVLAYLSRYTHRVAIANSRLITLRRPAVSPSPGRTIGAKGEPVTGP